MNWRNRVEVSYAALRHNVRTVCALVAPRQLVAVIKADAYGLGLERCARIYLEAGASAIAVAALSEADRVRRAAPGARVILLGSPLPEERPAVVASGYEVCCSTSDEIHEFAHHAGHGIQPVHLFIDTGMGRAGCPPDAAPELAEEIRNTPSLRLAGLGTHYPMAPDAELAAAQEASFAAVLDRLGELPEECLVHIGNSEGALLRPALGNAVRVGLLLTGVVPPGAPDPGLAPVLRWVSSISLVKRLPAGHGISYNRTAVLDRDATVALVPVGYADGYPLALSGRGEVLVQGRRCPVLGRVTMDYLIIDCTGLPRDPVPGDAVVLIGHQEDATITVEAVAERARTIPYDILCGLRGRCEVVGVP